MSDAEAVLAWVSEQEEVAGRAAKGPWEVRRGGGHKPPSIGCAEYFESNGNHCSSFSDEVCEMNHDMGRPVPAANATFIATARTSHPTALAMLRVYQRALTGVDALLESAGYQDISDERSIISDALARVRHMVEP